MQPQFVAAFESTSNSLANDSDNQCHLQTYVQAKAVCCFSCVITLEIVVIDITDITIITMTIRYPCDMLHILFCNVFIT
jgi:hypothetical protein